MLIRCSSSVLFGAEIWYTYFFITQVLSFRAEVFWVRLDAKIVAPLSTYLGILFDCSQTERTTAAAAATTML